MTFHKAFYMEIESPTTLEQVDAYLSFGYTAGYPDTYEEPGCHAEVELCACFVDGVDVIDSMSSQQIGDIESELLCSGFEEEWYEPDDSDERDCFRDCSDDEF